MQRSLFDSSPAPRPQQTVAPAEPRVYTVSQLSAEFKFLMESTYPSIWVEGEISNLTQPGSGHYYFTLKDSLSQIQCVMWKSNHRFLKWRPQNGMKIVVRARVTTFEQRSNYQLDIIQMSPHGKGDLYAAFEQLKEKLQKEGLFDQKRKRPIPLLPRKIGIVTSPTGAAIRDILNILDRRYANLHILLFPAVVQGDEAAPSIVEGIRVLNRYRDIDVLIVGRGGGSIEDLWPFNVEMVARSIVASRIPVISAVGHETDFTIADHVADLRAPTPSAAAELVVGKKSEFADKLVTLSRSIRVNMDKKLLFLKNRTQMLSENRSLAGVPNNIRARIQAIDEYELRLRNGLGRFHQLLERRCAQHKLNPDQLRHLIEVKRSRMNDVMSRMRKSLAAQSTTAHRIYERYDGMLNSLSPLSVLERGYSITTTLEGHVLKDAGQATTGETVRVRLHKGKLKCNITEIENE